MTEDPLLAKLLETAAMLETRIEAALQEVGLSRAKLATLRQLREAGAPVPLKTLAEGQGCVPSNMTTLIARLENEGLVSRTPDPDDRRSVLASLTPLGAERTDAGERVLEQVHRAFAASLRPAERVA